MKKLILILIFTSQIFATNWYCDGALTGTDNGGTSWADAWEAFDQINWASIDPGDVLFISGGADSLIYNEMLDIQTSGTSTNLITIRSGLTSGHNGRVIINGGGTRDHAVLVSGANSSGYLRIVKLEGRYTDGQGVFGILSGGSGQNITKVYIDSCRITDQQNHGGIFINGNSGSGQVMWEDATSYSDSIYIRWNYIRSKYQHPSPGADYGEDLIFLQSSKNIFIYGNTLINNNVVTINHSDCIQSIYMENVYVWNNWMYAISSTVARPDQVMMYENMRGRIVLYGNVLYAPNHVAYMNVFIDKDEPHVWKQYYIINNVFFGGDDGDTGYNLFNVDTDTAWCYNNIFQNNVAYTSEAVQFTYPRSGFTAPWSQVNGNLYGHKMGHAFYGETMTTMNGWGAETIGTPSQRYLVNPLFVNITYGSDDFTSADFHLQSGSPARDKGYNAQSIIEGFNIPGLEWKDIDGKTLDATPDIGAYQYATAGVDTIPSFSFTALTGRELNTEYIATSPITGTDSVSHFWTTTSASFKINYNGTYNTAMKTADPDNGADTVYVKNQSSGSYSTMTTETIVGGGYSRDFNVTTKADPGGGGVVNGGWISGSNGKKIYLKNGHALITRQP